MSKMMISIYLFDDDVNNGFYVDDNINADFASVVAQETDVTLQVFLTTSTRNSSLPVEAASTAMQHLAGPKVEVLLGVIRPFRFPGDDVGSPCIQAQYEDGLVDDFKKTTVFLQKRRRGFFPSDYKLRRTFLG